MEGQKRVRKYGGDLDGIIGTWLPNSSQSPYGDAKSRQADREHAAYFTHNLDNAIRKARLRPISDRDKLGVPLECFSYGRILVDEVHEPIAPPAEWATGAIAKDQDDGGLRVRHSARRREGSDVALHPLAPAERRLCAARRRRASE